MRPPAAPASPAASPLRGRYLVRSRLLHAALTAVDAVLALVPRQARAPERAPVRRLLLALGGHLGDAVLLTALLRRLRTVRPDVEIGVVLPSWSTVVLEHDPRVSWLHAVDHWKPNRSPISGPAKWRRYRTTRRTALREIVAVRYDAAVDLRPHFPNMAGVLRDAGIAVRLGFTSGGFGALYTHAVAWRDDHTHIVTRQLALLATVLGPLDAAEPLRAELTVGGDAAEPVLAPLVAGHGLDDGEYVVIHMGAGGPDRQWSPAGWRAVAEHLARRGHRVVFTGRGAEESAAIAEVAGGLSACVDLGDRLEWRAFVEVIRRARMVLTVDTVAAHVAAATATPCVVVWLDAGSAPYWRPLGEQVTLLVPDPATPSGAAEAGVGIDVVLRAAGDVLDGAPRELSTAASPAGRP